MKNSIPKIADMWEYTNRDGLHSYYIVLEYVEDSMRGDEVRLYSDRVGSTLASNMIYHKSWRLVK